MSKNTKIILNYPNYQHIITQYLNLEEFKQKATETMRSKRVTVTAFCNYLGDNGIGSIDLCQQKHVADFMENISVLSTSTKSGKAFILRHFFNYLHSLNLIPYSGNELFPVIMTNKRDRILSFYSEDEIKKLISHVDNRTISGKRDFLIVLLAAELGMRSGDICRLNIRCIRCRITAFGNQLCDYLRILSVILALAVVIQFLGLLYRIRVNHNQEDALILKISAKVKPVMTCWLDTDYHI